MLKLLGRIFKVVGSGSLVVRLDTPKPPPLGSQVFTSDVKRLGILSDVIGPTSEPYAVVKLLKGQYDLRDLYPGMKIYYKVKPLGRRRRRRGGRSRHGARKK